MPKQPKEPEPDNSLRAEREALEACEEMRRLKRKLRKRSKAPDWESDELLLQMVNELQGFRAQALFSVATPAMANHVLRQVRIIPPKKWFEFFTRDMALRLEPTWEQDKGQGLMLSAPVAPGRMKYKDLPPRKSLAESPMRNSTLEEDKEVKNIVFLGMDFNGRDYAYNYLRQFAPLLDSTKIAPGDMIVHHYRSNVDERRELCWKTVKHPNYVTEEVREIFRKYITPRLLDKNGGLRSNPAADGSLDINIIAHSMGCFTAKLFENACIEALTVAPEKYGLPKKQRYSDDEVKAILNSMHIAGVGLQMIMHENPSALHIPTLQTLAAEDSLTYRADYSLGLDFSHNMRRHQDVMDDAHLVKVGFIGYDTRRPNHMRLMTPDIAKPSHEEWVGVGGHSVAAYLQSLHECGLEDGKKHITTGLGLYSQFLSRRMGIDQIKDITVAKPMDVHELRGFAHTLSPLPTASRFLKLLGSEKGQWQEKAIKAGRQPGEHPIVPR